MEGKQQNQIIAANIKKLIKSHRITQKELANSVGISPSTLSDYMNLRAKPSHGVIQKIADYFGVGKSDIDTTYKEGSDLLATKSIVSPSHEYNYFKTSVAAGSLAPVETFTSKETARIRFSDETMGKYSGRKDIFVTRINGDSMNNIIPDQSLVAVCKIDSIYDLNDRDIVVFRKGSELAVKRFIHDKLNQRYIFRPDSTEESFTDIIITEDEAEDLEVYGKVVVYVVQL